MSLAGYFGKQELTFREISPSGLAHFAHLVIDVQRHFCDPAINGDTPVSKKVAGISAHIASVSDEFRKAGVRGWFVYYRTNRTGQEFYKVRPLPEHGDVIVAKHSDSVFRSTDIHQQFNAAGVNTLLVSGFNIGYCVRDSVLDALGKQYNVWLLRDCIGEGDTIRGGTSANLMEDDAVREMLERGAQLIDAAEALQRLPRPPGP